MSNKTIKITIEHCKNCNLAAHNAVDINTIKDLELLSEVLDC